MKFCLLKTFDYVLVWCDISTGRSRPYVTKIFKRKDLNLLHGLGHPSHRATKPLINSRFVWHDIGADTTQAAKQLKFHVIIDQFSKV